MAWIDFDHLSLRGKSGIGTVNIGMLRMDLVLPTTVLTLRLGITSKYFGQKNGLVFGVGISVMDYVHGGGLLVR